MSFENIPLTEEQKTTLLDSLKETAKMYEARLKETNEQLAAIEATETISREQRNKLMDAERAATRRSL